MKNRRLFMGGVFLIVALAMVLSGCTSNLRSKPPRALFAVRPAEGEAPLNVTFDASLSVDQGAKIVEYIWDFGDGSSAVGPIVSHTYTSGGSFKVTLRVFDAAGQSDGRSTELRVHHPKPTAEFKFSPPRPATGETIWFDAAASSSPNGAIVDYRWSFGDGEWSDEGPQVQYTYWSGKTYPVTLTITDEVGQQATVTHRVEVFGGPPCR